MQTFKWLAIEYFIKEQKSQGRPVKSKRIDFTVYQIYALTSLFMCDAADMGHPQLLLN
jgi:hypothetical protein